MEPSAASVSVERVIAAPPERIFSVLADPSQHPAIDGSGMVREVRTGEQTRLALGDRFGMSMRLGLPYTMANEVVEFEDNRRIAWAPRLARPPGLGRRLGGYVWRYELEPVDGGTRVRETYDWSRADRFTQTYITFLRWPGRAERAMTKTLERLDARVKGRP